MRGRWDIHSSVAITSKKIDGVYDSYWLGKFFNMFIKKGKKKKLFKHLYIALLNLKFDQNILPTIFITEMIERIRPNFKLTKYFPNKRGKICPRVVRNSQTYALAYHWVKQIINEEYINSRRSRQPFHELIYSNILRLGTDQKSILINKRRQYQKDIASAAYTFRFTWPKSLKKLNKTRK